MSPPKPDPENLRVEYGVLASYITAMTGMRFQTVAIYLAAVGLLVSNDVSPRSALLILLVSLGLWVLDLRNRDLLVRLGERGRVIEERWGNPVPAESDSEDRPRKGGAGFFLDESVPPRLRLLTSASLELPKRLPEWTLTHAFGIDVVFLGVIGYAIAVLADADHWPQLLIAFAPIVVGIALVKVLQLVLPRTNAPPTGRYPPSPPH